MRVGLRDLVGKGPVMSYWTGLIADDTDKGGGCV